MESVNQKKPSHTYIERHHREVENHGGNNHTSSDIICITDWEIDIVISIFTVGGYELDDKS